MQKTNKHKKALLFLFTNLLFVGFLFSQENDSIKSGVIYYKMKKAKANEGYKSINAELHFNRDESLFVFNKIGMDSIQPGNRVKTQIKDGKIAGIGIKISPIDKKGYIIYRNFDTNQIFLRVTKTLAFKPYIVQDNWLPIKWTIMDEYKKISGYNTQKAIAQFRGRIYIAWFTPEIPLRYGPWKLFGLPGLILEAYDTAKVVEFKLKEVCYPCKLELPIHKPYENNIKKMKEHVYIHDYMTEMFTSKIKNKIRKNFPKGNVYIEKPNLTSLEEVKDNRTRQPEIIYEWEEFPGDTPNPFNNQGKSNIPLETVPKNIPIEAEN